MDHDKPTPPPAAVDLPPTHYASWPRRAAALLIDTLPVLTFAAAAVGLMWLTRIRACDGNPSVTDMGPQCGTGVSSFGRVCFIVMWLAAVGYCVWNFGYRQGRTGSSLGKSLLRVKVVDAATGAPIGFWRSTIRQLTHLLEILTLGLGYLWPLWDAKHQTFADKLLQTVCVPAAVRETR